MTDITVERNLVVLEDLLLGVGVTTQVRGSATVDVTKINAAAFPYDADATLKEKIDSLSTSHYVDGDNLPLYIMTPHDATSLNLVDVIWIKDISATERWVYYFDKIMFKYNPTSGNLILDTSLFDGPTDAITAAYAAADVATYEAAIGALNTEISDRVAADSAITIAYTAADTALVTSLNLGTAANKNVGVAADNVLVLDGSARLPAVDGSLLTNLPDTDIPSGFILRRLFYDNTSATAINSSGEHNINPSASPNIGEGFALFDEYFTPQAVGNVILVTVNCPTIKVTAASNLVAVLTVFIGGTFVRAVTAISGNTLVVQFKYTAIGVAPVRMIAKIGIKPGTDTSTDKYYHINNTSYGSNSMGASLIIEEQKL